MLATATGAYRQAWLAFIRTCRAAGTDPDWTRDLPLRLRRLAAADGVALAQEIDKLIRERAPRPRPATGGFRSSRPLTAEEIDGQLAAGFGE